MTDVTMTKPEKFEATISRALRRVPGELGNRLRELMTPEAVATMPG